MHDQQNSPSQQPSKDYGAQDFLHLGEGLERHERDKASAPEPDGSWLLEGPEPSAEPPVTIDGSLHTPDSALPATPASEPEEASGWLMEMNDQAVEAPEVPVPAGVPGASRRLEATYLEPESSSEVIGRSLYRSLLPAASIVLLTVAGIGAWKMMGSNAGGSNEPAPIEFRAPQRAEILVSPNLDRRGPRGTGAAPSSPSTSNATTRRPVEGPSEPGELSIWPSGSEEELADPFELSDGPAVSVEAESTLEALDELIAGAPDPTGALEPTDEPVPVETTTADLVAVAVGSDSVDPASVDPASVDPASVDTVSVDTVAVDQDPVELEGAGRDSVAPEAADTVAVVTPLNDPAVADGPRRATLLPPAAWAMPVALSVWSSQGGLQDDSQEVVELVHPEALSEDVPLETSAVAEVEESVTNDEVDPIDAWLEADGTVPFSSLAEAPEPAPVTLDEEHDETAFEVEGPVAVFVPTEDEVFASQPVDVESTEVVAEVTVEPAAPVESPVAESPVAESPDVEYPDHSPLWQDEFWREHDAASDVYATADLGTEAAADHEPLDSPETEGLEAIVDSSTDEVASVEEPGSEVPEATVELFEGEEMFALEGDEAASELVADPTDEVASAEQPTPGVFEEFDETVDTFEGEDVAVVEQPAPDVFEEFVELDETVEAFEGEDVATVDGEEPTDDSPSLDVPTEVVAGADEPELGEEVVEETGGFESLEIFDVLPEEDELAVAEPSTLETSPTPEVELPEFGPIAVLTELPEDEPLDFPEGFDGPALEVLPALDGERVPETEVGVIDPWTGEGEALVAVDEPVGDEVSGDDVAVVETTGDEDLEVDLPDDSDELDELAGDAPEVLGLDEDPTSDVGSDDWAVAVGADLEVPEELVDAVDGDWYLGGPIHGPDMPGGYVQLDDEVGAPSEGEDVAQGPDEQQARPKSSLLGNGNLLGTYGDFIRSGRVPQGASPDVDVDVDVADATPPVPDTPESGGTEVESDPEGLARAASNNRWTSEEVPEHLFDSESRIYTPRVGDVRIELVSGDLLEGQLHSLGAGSVWLETRVGRMQLQLDRVGAVKRLGTVGKVVENDPDDRDYSNLPQVRVRTAGGVIVGRQLARDDESVTILTEDGIRMTLQSTDVTLANARQSVTGVRPR